MRRFFVALAIAVFCVPSFVSAQGLLPDLGLTDSLPVDAGSGDPADGGLVSNLAVLEPFNLGPFFVNPTMQIGYTWLGANITIPVQGEAVGPLGLATLQIGDLDMTIEDAEFWSGALGFNVIIPPKFTLFALAGGLAPRLVVFPGTVPVSLGRRSLTSTIEFTGSNLESWFIQLGGGYSVAEGYSVVGGFYWDHLSSELDDPRRPNGVPLANQTLTADLVAKTRFPFIGIQIVQPSYMASLLYSPVATADVVLAMRSNRTAAQDLQYKWNTPGDYVGFLVQYNTSPPPFVLSFWINGSWRKFQGDGELSLRTDNPNRRLPRSGFRSKDSEAVMGMYMIGFGATLGLIF